VVHPGALPDRQPPPRLALDRLPGVRYDGVRASASPGCRTLDQVRYLDGTVWPEAQADPDQLHAYFSADNPDAANQVQDASLATFEALATMPGMGQPQAVRTPPC